MTQDKELLLKDLCARLPYGIKLGFYASATKQTYICTLLGLEPQEDEPVIAKTENGSFYMLAGHVKPYLFPLSSMTEEQQEEFDRIYADDMQVVACNLKNKLDGKPYETNLGHYRHIDWLNANHFDYRGLIPKGLAIDSTGKNIY